MASVERPPKPYEQVLASVLAIALREKWAEPVDVDVSGRACVIVRGGRAERYLVPEEVITRAIAEATGAADKGGPSLVGKVELDEWDEEAGSEPVIDGTTWTEDGEGGHWCLEPETCRRMREGLP